MTIRPTEKGVNGSVIIASKQLFFSHYFDTGLELQILVRDQEYPEDGFYLVSLTRYRSSAMTGMVGSMVRRVVVTSVRDSLSSYLAKIKSATEQYFQDEQRR